MPVKKSKRSSRKPKKSSNVKRMFSNMIYKIKSMSPISRKKSKKSNDEKGMFSNMIRKMKSMTKRSDKSKKPSKMSRKCRERLSNKIAINTREYKSGRYKSPQQAIAVSYSQIKKMYPECNKYMRRKI